jgi:glycosyltransferase involved in cell wall biosynthesis
MEVLPPFVPDATTAERASRDGSPWGRPYFLFVGRLERIKGLQDVIPAFREYADADLLVAGDGDYASELRAQANGLERVHFLGRKTGDELAAYVRSAVAVVVPSVCYETFGIVVLEAFQQRTPVIARRLGPLTDIVATSGGGELFSDKDELVRGMRRMQADAGYRDRLGDQGYAAFLTQWSETVVVPRYLEIVRRAAERKGGRTAVRAAS